MSYSILNNFKLFVLSLVVLLSTNSYAIHFNELYSYYDEESTILRHGDSTYDFIQLETPIHFYSEKYNHIYVNTNGILTFVTEFSEYLNQPFPLEYPSIAPFYSNVDTTAFNETTNIVFFKSHNQLKITNALQLVRKAFPDAYDFQPTVLYVGTWQNVGYFKAKNDKTNTFQVAILCNDDESYVLFLYPDGGLNWIKAEIGESGLPDVRAQAGFISEDGRYYTIENSGLDSVKYLSSSSNVGVPGIWAYRVGALGFTENIEEPVTAEIRTETPPQSCAYGGIQKCHTHAKCIDTSHGFCCECNDGYYGNGFNCILNSVPIRVTGSLSGYLNNKNISENVKLQSYVVVLDGRSYTAINPIGSDIAYELLLAFPVGSAIGWIFAKPVNPYVKNGYQITGGHMIHTATLTFKNSDEILTIKQNFTGLNFWDQLAVNIEIFGNLPYVAPRSQLNIKDFTEEYFYVTNNLIQSFGTLQIEFVSQNKTFECNLQQTIEFAICNSGNESVTNKEPVLQKISKITVQYEEERAIRIGMLSKIGVDPHSNPCTDGSAICGDNTICVPREDDIYDCICKHGYAPYSEEDEIQHCTDIDECHDGNVCDEFAYCENAAGGYTCRCIEGYEGNGQICRKPREQENEIYTDGHPQHQYSTTDIQYTHHTNQEHDRSQTHVVDEHETTTYNEDSYHTSYTTEQSNYTQSNYDRYDYERDHDRYDPSHVDNRLDHEYEYNRHEDGSSYNKQDNDPRYNVENTERIYDPPSNDPYNTRHEYDNDYNRHYAEYNETRQDADSKDRHMTDHTIVTVYTTDRPYISQQPDHPYYPTEVVHTYSPCDRCAPEATCLNGACVCSTGWIGDGYYCSQICRPGELWVQGQCVPQYSPEDPIYEPYCSSEGECACPTGYEYHPEDHTCKEIGSDEYGSASKQDEVPCDVDFNCHENSTCEWSEHELKHICVCPRGYEGDGVTCTKIEVSCTMKEDLCDVNAVCIYVEALGKSECRCSKGYAGDGFTCQLAPECIVNEHCSANSYCDDGVCLCIEGYERDNSDYCVPAGICGGAYCATNAICKWDSLQKVHYCECLEGYIGDGVRSCKSIPIPCNVRNNCGLHASCLPSYRELSKYECVCDPGHYGDGYVCVEEKNCRNTPAMCDLNAKCITTSMGLQCVCNQGFLGNGTFCKEVSQHESGFLLISQGVVIIRIPFDGKLGRPISVSQMAIALDKDCAEGRVYWGDISAKKIMSSKYNGTDAKPFISDDIHSPEGIAIDWISRRLYWTDSTKDTIEVANLDNPEQRSIIIGKHLVNPRGIAVDPHKNKLYWSDWNRDAPKIEMSELDGTGREVLLSKPTVILPNSLVVLQSTGELCFADAGTHKIECLDTYTRQIRTIATNLSYPFGLTSTDDHFYWTDWTTKQIESVDIYGRRKQGIRTPVFGSHKMYGMTAIIDNCPLSYSPCLIDNGGCPADRLCLVNHKAPSSKSCKCIFYSATCPTSEYLDV